MKRRRLVLILALAVSAMVGYWSMRRPPGDPTPAACLDAYPDALADGDVARYRSCLGEPLRTEKRSLTSPELRLEMEGLKGWTCLEPVIEGTTARVDVDQIRPAGTCRVRFHLQRSGRGWLIVGL